MPAVALSAVPVDDGTRIMILDDEPANVRLLQALLTQSGYPDPVAFSDPREAVAAFLADPPDLLLLDLHMPHLDGFGVLDTLREVLNDTFVPVLVLTADVTTGVKQRALASGAKDFLTKPFDVVEALLRVGNLLETRRLHLRLQSHAQDLESRVQERTRELEDARLDTLERLALAAEYRDDDTYEHTRRVGNGASRIARASGMTKDDAELLRQAAPLHDVGKLGIPDAILLKPGRLTADEFDVIKTHTLIGNRILTGSRTPALVLGAQIALGHHERWDGSGYPHGLVGESISVQARIVSLIDVYDALTHERPYKHAWPFEEAMAEIERQRGAQFDPRLVDVFVRMLEHEGLREQLA
jgi:putative two-component system response regulator